MLSQPLITAQFGTIFLAPGTSTNVRCVGVMAIGGDVTFGAGTDVQFGNPYAGRTIKEDRSWPGTFTAIENDAASSGTLMCFPAAEYAKQPAP